MTTRKSTENPRQTREYQRAILELRDAALENENHAPRAASYEVARKYGLNYFDICADVKAAIQTKKGSAKAAARATAPRTARKLKAVSPTPEPTPVTKPAEAAAEPTPFVESVATILAGQIDDLCRVHGLHGLEIRGSGFAYPERATWQITPLTLQAQTYTIRSKSPDADATAGAADAVDTSADADEEPKSNGAHDVTAS